MCEVTGITSPVRVNVLQVRVENRRKMIYVCLSVYLPPCLYVSLPSCMPVCVSVSLSVCPVPPQLKLLKACGGEPFLQTIPRDPEEVQTSPELSGFSPCRSLRTCVFLRVCVGVCEGVGSERVVLLRAVSGGRRSLAWTSHNALWARGKNISGCN